MKNVKIIMLDIDGVMMSASSKIRHHDGAMMHPEHVEALNFILKHVPDAYIVVTSTYRWMYDLKELCGLFEKHGIDGKRVVGKTPMTQSFFRGEEVKMWLDKWVPTAKVKNIIIDKFIILDDDTDFHVDQRKDLIQTNKNYGLTFVEAQKAVNHLNGIVDVPKILIKRQTDAHLKLVKGM